MDAAMAEYHRPAAEAEAAGVEAWRWVLRRGVLPGFTRGQLAFLRAGLLADDPRLVQGRTTIPPPLMCVQDWPCEGACFIGFARFSGLAAGQVPTVGQVEEAFARLVFDSDERVGAVASTRHLLNWFDDSPRAEVRRELVAELDRELAARPAEASAA